MKQIIIGVVSFFAGLTLGIGILVGLFSWEV